MLKAILTKKLFINIICLFTATITGIFLINLFSAPSIPVIIGIILFPLFIISTLKPKLPIFLLLISIMFTEFYWVEVMEGYLKPFHIISVILFMIFSVFHLRNLKLSKIFWFFVSFLLICLISIAFSTDWKDSLRSFILPLILFSITLNIFIALYSKKISEDLFIKIILYGSIITTIFAIIQIAAYSFTGILLTLTQGQDAQIVIAKRPPSFFTEADTFGKFLILPFLFFLPFALDKNNKYHKKIKIIIFIFLFGIIINMTRSAMIGLGITCFIYILYLLKRQSISRNIAIIYVIASLSIIIIPFFFATTKIVGSHEELTYRIQTLINPSTMIVEDPSAVYRKRGVEETLEGSIESLNAFLIGHGWGSAIISTKGEPKDVGGTLFINILYYSGIFALILYIFICAMIIRFLLKAVRENNIIEQPLFAEGILFTFIGMLITSQIASMWIAPEFWLVIGCGIYFEILYRQKKSYTVLNKFNP